MTRSEKTLVKDRIYNLILRRCTGSPGELASTVNLSERTVKRLIKEMRDEGKHIIYDNNCMSYRINDDS
jgi:DNA-binding Lrp family transcriptional regulator